MNETGAGELIPKDTAKESECFGCDLCDEPLLFSPCIDTTLTEDSKAGTESMGIACNATDPGVPTDTGAYEDGSAYTLYTINCPTKYLLEAPKAGDTAIARAPGADANKKCTLSIT